MERTNILNLRKICRTCFSDKSLRPMVNITLEEGLSITDILIDFINSKDLYNDKLPQNLCSFCVDQLTLYYNFKTKCTHNENFLKSYLENPRLNEEDSQVKELENEEECTYLLSINDTNDLPSSDDEKPLICRVKNPRVKKKALRKNLTKKRTNQKSNNLNGELPSKLRLEDKDYSCKQCNKSFRFKYKLVMHMRVHTNEKPFQCDICHLTFSLNGNLKRHQMIHTGERPHICKICGKGFIQATSLQTHAERRHKENVQQNFTCRICSRIFIRAAPYNSHLKKYHPTELTKLSLEESTEKTHKDVKSQNSEYKCEICEKVFVKFVFLKRHTSRHGEKKFLCSNCGKGFVRKADLQSHFKVHTGEKPHKCPICNKAFAHTGSLVTHSLVHSGYKPYNCSLCSKSFSQLSHLKVHKRIHSGERPYSCSYCGKTFALKSNLTVHIRTHTGETPYICNVCEKGFYDSSSMKKHKLSHLNVLSKEESDVQKEDLVNIKSGSDI